MKAKRLIEILEKYPDLEVGLLEMGRYEDNIPILLIHSVEYQPPSDDDSNETICIRFLTAPNN